MPRYFQRHWNESRGDEYDHWGAATYYFEADAPGGVRRQVEVYADGTVLRYGAGHAEDAYGQLTDQPLDLADASYEEVDQAAFESVWNP